jgi:hypothetical protein
MATPTTASLFDDGLDKDFGLVEVLARTKPITKAQQHFQRLVARIELKREQLKQWQAYALRYNQRLAGEMEPLRNQLRTGQRQMAALIDELLSQPMPARRLGRVQRAKLRQVLMNLVTGLLQDGNDESLAALRDKYSDVSDEQWRRSEMDLTEALLTDVFGLEVDADHGATSAEELLQHAQRKMQARADREAHLAQEKQNAGVGNRSKASAAKAEAARAQREQAAREVGQSLRDVYRKLVSALHPDREPDADARQRKTLLMQRVNQAYDGNDLLTLLGLQLEIEQIDAAHLSSVPPHRLGHYNQILREQLTGLESELERCVQPFRDSIGWQQGRPLTVAAVDQYLSADIAQLRSAIRELHADLVAFRDPIRLRANLEHYELEQEFDDPGDLAELMDILQASARAPRGRSRR